MSENTLTFRDLGLSEKLLAAIEKKGYTTPSDIQAGVIPLLLTGDKDIIGQAQTGTGKTASFGLPLLERLDMSKKWVQAIVLTPTRELAIQVAKEIGSFADSGVKITLLYGGQNIRDEIYNLKGGTHIVVGTPGRVKDHLITKRTLDLSTISYFILDEADEMLNIGFREEIEEILTHTPEDKKTLLFSATMPREILLMAKKYMKDYDTVAIKSATTISQRIDQKYYEVSPRNKFEALCRVIDITDDFYGIVFCKTKLDVDEVASKLMARGMLAEGIHGDIEQKTREKILARFKAKKTNVLVATDVAARGIDIDNLTHVVNHSLPDSAETYTHRIGRTARAGKSGIAISFISRLDSRKLFAIERLISQKIKKELIPTAQDVVEHQKKALKREVQAHIETWATTEYTTLATSLLELWDATAVVAALLKHAFDNAFHPDNYTEISEKPMMEKTGEQRIFIARGKLDDMIPGTLIKMIESDVGISLGDVGKIDIMEKFSYMNLQAQVAEVVLSFYKAQNPRMPLVVQAKGRNDGGGSGGRTGWYSKSYGGERKSFGGGERKSFGSGERKTYGGERKSFWERKTFGDKKREGGRSEEGGKSYGWRK